MRPRRRFLPLGGAGEGHQPDDPLQSCVAQLDAVQQRCCILPEQGAVEWPDLESVVERAGQKVGFAAVKTVPDQPKQRLDTFVDVVAVRGFVACEADEFEVAQVFQTVPFAVCLGVNRSVAEFRAGLDVEQEQQAVHVAQGFQAQLTGKLVVELIYAFLAHLPQIPDGLVANKLNGFAERVLEVFGDGEGVFVAVVVQVVEQTHAFGGEQTVPVQEGGGGLKSRKFAPAQDVVKYKAQQAVVGPLAAFDQQDLAGREEQYPTSRMPLAKYAPGDDVVPGFLQEGFRRRDFTVVLHQVGAERERVFIFSVRVVGAEDEQLCRAMPDAASVEHGDFIAGLVVQDVVGRGEVVAQGGQELAKPVALQTNAGLVAALATKLLAKFKVGAGQGAQGLIGGALSVLGFRGGFAPSGRGGLDIVGEDFRQVVVAVELVLVLDAGESGGHVRSASARCYATAFSKLKSLSAASTRAP